jgi:carbon storage regulator
MLVLTRKVGEKILVPQCQLTVTVLDIASSRVRLGVSAPPGVTVHREEVQNRIAKKTSLPLGDISMSARILIADTDRFLLASYSEYLRARGAVVATATTGLECMQRLHEAVPDVLVMEPALLSGGGGDAFLTLMHERPEMRPSVVIVLAKDRDRRPLYRLSSFKVDDYQMKPMTAARLTEQIGMLLTPG